MTARWPKLGQDGVPTGGVVLLDFYQASCAPCRTLEPRLEAFARRHTGELRVMQVDVDEDADTARQYSSPPAKTMSVGRLWTP